MRACRAEFPLSAMCRALRLSRSGYHDWLRRGPSAREAGDGELAEVAREIWLESRCTYGRPRIHAAMRARGVRVGHKRLARLMREAGIRGVTRRRGRSAARRAPAERPAPDLVRRDFSASGPDELWVADITQVRTARGWLYVATVLDAWSRKVVGWAAARHMRGELVRRALRSALGRRGHPRHVIHHSDRGSQYTSGAFAEQCREAGVRRSMGEVGSAYDNAMQESFFATMECELLDFASFRTRAEARKAGFAYIEGFYNTRRLHSALGYRSPEDFERSEAA